LHKETIYAFNRIIINLIIIISLVIPLLVIPNINFHSQLPLSEIKEISFSFIPEGSTVQTVTNTEIIYTSTPIIDYIKYIYLGGIIIFLIIPLIGYSRIFRIIKKSEIKNYPDFKLALSKENITAFNLGKYIVISHKDFHTKGEIILSHEKAHLKYKHSIDTIIWQVFRLVFWFNPFFILLQRNLRQIHEYQADSYTLNSGIDASKYQLTLLEQSVGQTRFALANSISNSQIKKRIIMMNINTSRKMVRWKIIAFFPILAFLLFSFSKNPTTKFDNIVNSLQNQVQKTKWTEKDFQIKEIIRNGEMNIIEDDPEISQSISILMNKNSDLLVNEKYCAINKVSEKLSKLLNYELSDEINKQHFKKISGNSFIDKMVYTSEILIQVDRSADKNDYSKLINAIGDTFQNLRNKYSKSIFNTQYSLLDNTQKGDIDALVPINVYIVPPKQLSPAPVRSNSIKLEVMADVYSLQKNQSGVFKGKITDRIFNEPILYASVQLSKDENKEYRTFADSLGNFIIKGIPSGEYALLIRAVGYNTYKIKDFKIKKDKVITQNYKLTPSTTQIKEVVVKPVKIKSIVKERIKK